jgi:hypothetical protein
MKWLFLIIFAGLFQGRAFSLDREAFTFTHYSLDVRIEPDQQRFGVRGKLTLRNDTPSSQKYVCLQISSSMGWRSIQLEGQSLEFTTQPYSSDIDHTGALSEALVTLPHDVSPHGTVELAIGYEGTITMDATRLERIGVPKSTAKNTDWDEIGKAYTVLRGVGYVTWYPVAMESANLSDADSVARTVERWEQREAQSAMEISLSVFQSSAQGEMKVLCSGETRLPRRQADSQTISTDCSFSPLGLSTPVLVAGNYSILDRPSITLYYLSEHKAAAETFALASEAQIPFISDWFGPPKEKVKVVEHSVAQNSPFETGITLFTPLLKDDSTSYESAAVHQLTHAAFPSSRKWIYEGLAHFSQALQIEHKSGRQAALTFTNSHLSAIVATEKSFNDPSSPTAQSLVNTDSEEFYRSKALDVWWMLRDMIGEPALRKALAAYRSSEDKETSYMPALISKQSSRDLEWFFDDWVYRDRGLPDFRVESAYVRKLIKGGFMVTVTVEDLGNAGADVPVIVRMEQGQVTGRLEVRGKSKTSIRIEAVSIPMEVQVNDGSVPETDMSNNNYKIPIPSD